MNHELIITVMAILFGGVYAMQMYLLKRLNFTCGVVGKIVTFLKLVHPDKADALD